MSDVRYDDIRLFLADPRAQVRNSLRMALNDAGLRNGNIFDGADIDSISNAVQELHGPDIIICDVSERTDHACKMFSAIRHNEIGTNPFVCIIAVAWSPKQPLVSKVINSGADLLVAAPISPKLILDRISSLVKNRKPFVVTSEYVGPDRRTVEERDSTVPLIDVPNTLRDKALGQFNANRVREQIAATTANINDQKIDRHAFQLSYLADLIIHDYTQAVESVDRGKLKKLADLTDDLRQRALASNYTDLAELCVPLKKVVTTLVASDGNYTKRDIELLTQLSLALRASVRPQNRNQDLVHDISQTVIEARATA